MASVSDFIASYWWALILFGIVLIIWLWPKLHPDIRWGIRKRLTKTNLFLICFAFAWWLWWKKGGRWDIAYSNFWMPFFLLMAATIVSYAGKLKYDTQQLVCTNGYHGSFSWLHEIDGFIILAIGSFSAGGFHWKKADRVCVMRKETFQFCVQGGVSVSSPAPVSAEETELPPLVNDYVKNNPYLKGRPVDYGWFDDIAKVDYTFEQLYKLNELDAADKDAYEKLKREFKVENPKVSTLFLAYRNVCKAYNNQTKYFDAAVDSVEKGAEHWDRARTAFTGSSRPQRQSLNDEEIE